MAKQTTEDEPEGSWKYALYLTREERRLLITIVGIVLLGLTARYLHLRGQTTDVVPETGSDAGALIME
jgi:hypothetical protein